MPNIGLKFKGGSTTSIFTEEFVPLNINGYRFPMECLVDVRGQKRIVKTKIPGADGTIKEYVGMDDYQITVNAVIQDWTFEVVYLELSRLIEIWENVESMPILCPKTDLYGINFVVFESFSHPEMQGMEGTERLTLTFSSDDGDYQFGVE